MLLVKSQRKTEPESCRKLRELGRDVEFYFEGLCRVYKEPDGRGERNSSSGRYKEE